MQKISITRSLVQLKVLDDRIKKQTVNSLDTARIKVKDAIIQKPGYPFNANQDLQSIEDLIAHRHAIKTALMRSNMNTMVTIGDASMSVLDAIELKSTIDYQKLILRQLKRNLTEVTVQVERHNDKMETQLKGILEAMAQGDNLTAEEIENVSGPFRDNNLASVSIEGFNNNDEIKRREEWITTFESEVDFILSESNAITQIEV